MPRHPLARPGRWEQVGNSFPIRDQRLRDAGAPAWELDQTDQTDPTDRSENPRSHAPVATVFLPLRGVFKVNPGSHSRPVS